MKSGMRLRGADRIDRNLRATAKVAEPERVKSALMVGAIVIRDEARTLAPMRRGILRESIIVSDTATSATFDRKFVTIFVGPDSSGWHGVFVEFGTVNMTAEPFMRPAFDMKTGAAAKASAKYLRDEWRSLIR